MKTDNQSVLSGLPRPVVLSSMALLAGIAVARGFEMLGNWNFTHFLFNYEDEFLKRALVGEVLRLVTGDVDYSIALLASITALLLLTFLLFLVFILPYLKNPSLGSLLFAAVALASPATIQHFAYDLGRFDIFNLLIALMSIFAIQRLTLMAAALTVYLLLTISLLVHEAAFFIYVPMVFGYWFYRERSTAALMLQILLVVMAVGLTYVISSWGLTTLFSLDEHIAILTDNFGDQVHGDSVRVLHGGGFLDNIRYTYWRAMNMSNFLEHLVMFTILSPLFILLFRTLHPIILRADSRVIIALALSVSPLALYPLGLDFFRWWALAITNLLILLAVLAAGNKEICEELAKAFEKNRTTCLIVIGTGLIVGPLLMTDPFIGVKM